jgi:hypothetical protein
MKNIYKTLLVIGIALLLTATAYSEEKKTEKKKSFYSVVANVEFGFLAVADHKIQFGQSGSYIDYVNEGGQDVLLPVARMSLDLILAENHRISFLYQPLEIKTQATINRNMSIAGVPLGTGNAVEFVYSFPFYRLSYAYDIISGPKHTVAFGASIQIRNAVISFRELNGPNLNFVSQRNIGPVPVLKFYWKTKFDNGLWIGAEIDGFYAPISLLNGSQNEVVGAIVDTSLRGGLTLSDRAELFLNFRYLAGGSVGTSDGAVAPSDGYTKNWLHFITVTAGASFRLI